MTLNWLFERFMENSYLKREPTTVRMGTRVYLEYVQAVERLPLKNRPYGHRWFNGAEMVHAPDLGPDVLVFGFVDGDERKVVYR